MKTHLDGPKLARWLRKQGYATTNRIGQHAMRRIHAWEHEQIGPVPYVGALDRLLTKLYIHDWELPDDLWTDPPACVDCGVEVGDHRTRCDPCRRARSRKVKREGARRRREARQKQIRELNADPMVGLVKTDHDIWVREKTA